ncbi:MAG: type IV secretion system protein, partial [Zoogloeaceae bacterium]|nr:type IV secretion system protein [Zoogloeaceae bacterium]
MDPRLRNYLPEDWKNVYDKVRKMGASGLTGEARAIYDAVKKYDACKRLTGDYKATCEARAVKAALDAAYYTRAFDLAKERLNQIEGMLDAAAK